MGDEMDTIKAENEKDVERLIEQKVQKVIADSTKGDSLNPLPCQSEESKKLLAVLANHWKNKQSNQNGKKRFKSRKQNSKKWRKTKQANDYGDRLAAKVAKAKRKRKARHRQKFKPYQ